MRTGRNAATCLLVSLFLLAGMLAAPSAGFAKDETPANLTPGDSGDTIPVSLFRGHVSNQPSRYILGPGDTVTIKVQDMDNFNQKLTIRPDGYGTIHPFGEYYMAGLDVEGLQGWLEDKLKFYLLKPQVTVDIDSMRPALIYVTGAVRRSGTYQFIREGLNNATLSSPLQEKVEITLTNVLAKAGGVNEFADIEHITVQHASTGDTEVFNLRDLLTKGDAKEVWLLPGDTINVPAMSTAMDPETFKLISRSTFYKGKFPVVVLGAVLKQGEVDVDPENNTLNAAIGLAGGFTKGLNQTAETNNILVQRPGNNGSFNRWTIDRRKSNFELQPGDVIFVADSKISNSEHFFRYLSTVANPYFFGTAATSNLRHVLELDVVPK